MTFSPSNDNYTHKRAQTSANANIFFKELKVSGCLSDLSQNVDALSCPCQSFRHVCYKSAVDGMKNANKCPKIVYSAVVKKVKSDLEFTRGSGSPSKVIHF